jgi:monoamine oxidase
MYSAFAAAADANAVDESSYLFGQSHDDIMSLPTSHESTLLKASVPTIPISGIDNLMYGHYNESIPSSIHYTGINEVSEASGSHTSTRDGGDGSLYSGYETRHERSYTPSLLHSTQPNQNSRSNGLSNGTFYLTSIKPDSERTLSPIANGTIAPGPQAIPYSTIRDINGQHSIARSLQTPEQDPKSHSSPEPSKVQTVADSRHAAYANAVNGKGNELRANSSIPDAMSWEEFARQSILGAESSRLNPFALHVEEYKLLRSHITHTQVTTYLNIRNAILRLWTKNPLVNVTMEEAAGCARDKRYFGLAKVAYYWLLRNGYINFGCVEVTNTAIAAAHPQTKLATQKKVLVIGAGMAGLGCARQLEGLFSQLGDQWANGGQQPPKVTVLEARPRVGGRVYSHPLRDQTRSSLPRGHRCTAEMGAQIVTGFERGNPMNTLIRGQLGLPYHGLRDNTILYDYNGTIVERSQDLLVEKLYNDVLERASIYRHKPSIFRTVEGDRNLILFGRDPNDSGGPTIATLENSQAPLPASATTTASTTEETPSSGVEKLAGRAYQLSSGFNPSITAAETAGNMGWELNSRATKDQTVNLDSIAKASQYPTLGKTMDEGIRQYQAFLDLKPQDLRLLNWHHANLEYANAVSVNQLSLSGWDQDIGNEFEGEHTEVIGGYQQVPRGLWQCPGKLDVRFKSVVKTISYSTEKGTLGKAVRVECHNGEVHEADQLVITTPLGVLKSGSIGFEPALPEWKEGVIERMGFGLLNKVRVDWFVCYSSLTLWSGHPCIRRSILGASS